MKCQHVLARQPRTGFIFLIDSVITVVRELTLLASGYHKIFSEISVGLYPLSLIVQHFRGYFFCCAFLLLFSSCCPFIRGEVGHDYTVIFSSSFLFSSHFSLAFSSNNLQRGNAFYLLLLIVLHSPPILSRSLLMLSYYRILDLPRIPFLSRGSSFWASALPIFHLPFFPYVRPISTYSSPVSS